MSDPIQYEELTQYILDCIFGKDAAVAKASMEDDRAVVRITSASDNVGKIVGKGGRTISAIRSVVRAAGLRHQEKVFVEVGES